LRILVGLVVAILIVGLGVRLFVSDAPVIEVIALETVGTLQVVNNSDVAVRLVSLEVTAPQKVGSFMIGIEARPDQLTTFRFERPKIETKTMEKMAGTWSEHLDLAEKRFPGCLQGLAAFATGDPALRMIQEAYRRKGQELGSTDGTATLYYRLSRSQSEEALTIPVVVTVLRRADCKS
jgi:hypothetical protein